MAEVEKKTTSKKKTAAKKKTAVKKKTVAKKKASTTRNTVQADNPVDEPATANVSAEPVIEQQAAGVESRPEEADESPQNETPANSRERAAASRKLLLDQLRSDLETGKVTLKAAGVAAKKDYRLIRTVVDSQLDVLKEQLSTALSREDSLLSIGRRQADKLIVTGKQLGELGLKKARDTADRLRRKTK